MPKPSKKRQVDFQVIAQWVNPGDRVLDLGCGRGVLLEYLMQKCSIYGVGVDIDFDKILSCVKRRVPAYQGDIKAILATFPDQSFDRVIFSRTVEQLDDPEAILNESLRVGKSVTVGFVNYGFWKNRFKFLFDGENPQAEILSKPWYQAVPSNHFSINEFEAYCQRKSIVVKHRASLDGNWKDEVSVLPNLLSGYAIYDISKA